MVEAANLEEPGGCFEPTSSNTGISLTLVAHSLGYRLTCVIFTRT